MLHVILHVISYVTWVKRYVISHGLCWGGHVRGGWCLSAILESRFNPIPLMHPPQHNPWESCSNSAPTRATLPPLPTQSMWYHMYGHIISHGLWWGLHNGGYGIGVWFQNGIPSPSPLMHPPHHNPCDITCSLNHVTCDTITCNITYNVG